MQTFNEKTDVFRRVNSAFFHLYCLRFWFKLDNFLRLTVRKMLSISWQEHRTNDSILTELGLERELMVRVAKLKLQYFGHITRGSAGQLALTVLEGIIEGLRHQGRPRRQWIHRTWHWRVHWLRIHSAEGDVTRSSTMENKDIGVVVCCRQPSSRKVD